jgi:hypothetical protein
VQPIHIKFGKITFGRGAKFWKVTQIGFELLVSNSQCPRGGTKLRGAGWSRLRKNQKKLFIHETKSNSGCCFQHKIATKGALNQAQRKATALTCFRYARRGKISKTV